MENKDNTNRQRMVCVVASYWLELGVSSDPLKGIVGNHLPQQYKVSRKEININDSYDGSKLFTKNPGACNGS